jgi:hypothetical protein
MYMVHRTFFLLIFCYYSTLTFLLFLFPFFTFPPASMISADSAIYSVGILILILTVLARRWCTGTFLVGMFSSPVRHHFSLEAMQKDLPTQSQISAFDMRSAIRAARRKYSLKLLQPGKHEPVLQVSVACQATSIFIFILVILKLNN